MARKRAAIKRTVEPDPKYMDVVVTRFINTLMFGGKKSTAERILYSSIERMEEATNEGGIKAFRKALDNVKPVLEVKSRRVGGATYQVPVEVKPSRRQSLATRWLIEAARGRPEKNMSERLAAELIEAYHGRGGAMKKREDVHRMAEANKAFSHFRW